MKKFFIILGALFLVLIVLAAVGIGIAAFKGAALDKESKARGCSSSGDRFFVERTRAIDPRQSGTYTGVKTRRY